MKTKPNTDQFIPKKDPMDFLEGGAADLANKIEKPQQTANELQEPIAPTTTKTHREQKIFRLPIDLINELKRQSYERSMKTGSRVTETELVEQALKAFFNR
jgi:hypothetical protein